MELEFWCSKQSTSSGYCKLVFTVLKYERTQNKNSNWVKLILLTVTFWFYQLTLARSTLLVVVILCCSPEKFCVKKKKNTDWLDRDLTKLSFGVVIWIESERFILTWLTEVSGFEDIFLNMWRGRVQAITGY